MSSGNFSLAQSSSKFPKTVNPAYQDPANYVVLTNDKTSTIRVKDLLLNGASMPGLVVKSSTS